MTDKSKSPYIANAVVLGIGAAILRKILSNLRKKYIPSPPASQK